jgi:hypothetical protein
VIINSIKIGCVFDNYNVASTSGGPTNVIYNTITSSQYIKRSTIVNSVMHFALCSSNRVRARPVGACDGSAGGRIIKLQNVSSID